MKRGANEVFTTREACQFLKISRPTFLKLIYTNQIRAKKLGRGWKLLKSELETYMSRGGGVAQKSAVMNDNNTTSMGDWHGVKSP